MRIQEHLQRVRIQKPEDVLAAALAFRELAYARFPCLVAACHNIAVSRPMCDAEGKALASEAFGWSPTDKWWRTPQLALASPLPAACRFEAEPFWANAEGFHTRSYNSWLEQIDLTDFERRAHARAAIVIPIHLPFGQIGAVAFNPIDRELTDLSQQFEEHSDYLGVLSRTFVSSYQRVMVRPERLPIAGSALSKREVECLRWAAIGKTDYEIAAIMERSRATVRFHIHNAATKLDAVNRSQAVFKATQLGFIGLNS